MYKKILLVSLVILFSTTLISKEKVFLDLVFLKNISEKVEKACELKKNGKSVKSDKIKRPYTTQEKYKKMEEINPLIKELKETLGFELDY